MYQHTEYEMLLQKKHEITQRIHDLMGDMQFFPDESDPGIDEWSPENETQLLWSYKLEGEIRKLEVREKKINYKLGALKRQERRILQARG